MLLVVDASGSWILVELVLVWWMHSAQGIWSLGGIGNVLATARILACVGVPVGGSPARRRQRLMILPVPFSLANHLQLCLISVALLASLSTTWSVRVHDGVEEAPVNLIYVYARHALLGSWRGVVLVHALLDLVQAHVANILHILIASLVKPL